MPRRMGLKQDVALALSTPLMSVRDRRRFVEQEWLKNYAAWQGWPNHQYTASLADDTIRYFIPAARRAVERMGSRIVKLLTPKTPWFETQPFDDASYDNAEAVHAYMRYVSRRKIPFRRNLSALSRCLLLYNFAVLRTSVQMDAAGDVWPMQRTVDPFSFYVFPENATNASEALMMFEDMILPFEMYQSYVDSGLALRLSPAELTTPQWPYHLIERYAYRGLTNPTDFSSGVYNSPDRLDSVISSLNGVAVPSLL